MEIWKTIEFNKNYQVSTLGRVKSYIGNEKILKPQKNPAGYTSVRLQGKRYLIHRLVAITFLSNKEEKLEVNHKNKIRTDNRLENLEWATRLENVKHQFSYIKKTPDFSKLINVLKQLIPL